MTTNVYDAHKSAFAAVSAYVVLKDGERVATIAIKYGAAVTAFVHWIGVEMTKGRATGGGYDRQSAAVADAAHKITLADREDAHRDDVGQPVTERAEFVDAACKDGGNTWIRSLEDAGFSVIQAV